MRFLERCLIACALLGSACGESETPKAETQVLLRLSIEDEEMASELTALSVSLLRKDESWVPANSVTIPREKIEWPLEIGITPSSADASTKPFEVVVDVIAGSRRIAQARAISFYVLGSKRLLPISLRACANEAAGPVCAKDDCHGEACTTCGASGTCETVLVTQPEDLPPPETDRADGGLDGGTRPPSMWPTVVTTDPVPTDAGADGSITQVMSVGPDAGRPAPVCKTPATEICDGADNDCDGKADNGISMMCVRGTREACTFTAGTCSTMGTRECNSICSFGACQAPVEAMCNRKDDNCNGVVDEQLLKIGGSLPLAGYDGELWSVELAGAPPSSSAQGGYFAAFITRATAATKSKLTGLRIAADGRPLGSPIALADDVGTSTDVAWNGTSWAVAYTNGLDQGGWSNGVTYVTVDPSSGALGPARLLSSGGASAYVRLAGSSPTIAVWNEGGGIFGAALTGTAQKRTILAAPAQGTTSSISYHYIALTAVEDGREWALVTGGTINSSAPPFNHPVRYLSLDASINVTRNVLLTQTTTMWGIWELTYVPESQRLISNFSDNGTLRLATFMRDGTGLSLNLDRTSLSGSLVPDTNGYAVTIGNALYRYTPTGGDVEVLVSNENFGSRLAAVPTPESTSNRYAVAGGHEGGMRMFFIGCK